MRSFFLLLLFFPLALSAHKNESLESVFINLLNNYKTDSLNLITTDDFQIKRTFTSYKTSKTDFLGSYMNMCKALNGKFIPEKVVMRDGYEDFLVEDKSDYYSLLHIDSCRFILHFEITGDAKISVMVIDTLPDYQLQSKRTAEKEKPFTDWRTHFYPDENSNAARTMELVREFAKRKIILKSEYIRKGNFVYYHDSLFTGTAIKRAENNQIIAEENYKDGLPNGMWREWFETGEKKFEGANVNGNPDGEWIEWEIDGTVTKKVVFKDGKFTLEK